MDKMIRWSGTILLLLSLVGAFLLHGASRAADAGDVALLSEGEEGVLLRYTLPELVVDSLPGGMVALSAAEHSVLALEGAPLLPVRHLLIALPPGASAEAELLDPVFDRTDAFTVAPVPRVRKDGEPVYLENETYAGGLFPDRWVEVSSPANLRRQRVVTLTIYPARHDFRSGETVLLREGTVRVRFSGALPTSGAVTPKKVGTNPFETLYDQTLVNASSARGWRALPPSVPEKARPAEDSFASGAGWIKIRIAERGLYRVSYQDLVGAGMIDPRTTIGDARSLRMYAGSGLPLPERESSPRPDWMGQVAIRVVGEEDGSFDPGDEIEFYGLGLTGWLGEYEPDTSAYYEHVSHPYDRNRVYWLTWGGTFTEPVRDRIPSVDGSSQIPGAGSSETLLTFTDRVHEENDYIQDLTRYGEDGWFWDRFSATEDDKTFFVFTPDVDESQEGNVKVRFYHYADEPNSDYCGTERAWVTVNDVEANRFEYNSCRTTGGGYGPGDFDSTALWVENGYNTVNIRVTFRRKVYLAWIEIGFQRFLRGVEGELHLRIDEPGLFRVPVTRFDREATRVFDVSDPLAARELTGLESSGDSLVFFTSLEKPGTFHVAADSTWSAPLSIERVTPAGLRSVASGAEYVIICYDDFVGAIGALAAHRSAHYSVRVVKLSDVFNEFSWGLRDPVAIRDFLSHAYYYWPEEERPVFALLVGDATSDFKGNVGSALHDLVPTFFRIDPYGSETQTYATDDFFSYLDPSVDGEQDWAPDIAVGRFPANSSAEVELLAEKTIEYEQNPEFGEWRGRFLFLGDDELRGQRGFDCGFLLAHTSDIEAVADAVPECYDRERVYMVEYPLTSGGLKPLAKQAFIGWVNEGVLLTNYMGHGGVDKIADEELLMIGDASPGTIDNGPRLHVFSAFSCSVGSFDLLDKNSLAETLLKLLGGGAVASFSSDAPAFASVSRALNVNWMRALVPECHVAVPIGMAALTAKAVAGGSRSAQKINDEKYILLGDPAFLLGVPEMGVRFEEEGSTQFQRGRVDTIFGEVVDGDGALATGFNGVVDVVIWGMADTTGYSFLDTACSGTPNNPRKNSVAYELHGPTFFRGAMDVSGGRFSVPFFVPVDTRVGDLCRVRAYVQDANTRTDGIGADDSVRVIAEPPGTIFEDQTGPELKITVNGAPMRNGISFTRNAVFGAEISDPSGINLQQNDNFFTIHVVLDRGRPVDLTGLFEYKRNSYQEGNLTFRFDDLSSVFLQEGTHELSFRAADNLNNRTELDYQVFVVAEGAELSFRSDVLNYPNPFDPGRDRITDIVFELSQSARVSIQILTPTGKRIREIEETSSQVVRIPWDGRDQDGDPVANGVYLIRAVAEADDGSESVESIGKAVVLRGAR